MDSHMQSPPLDNADTKAAFRKPLNDVVNRKYRRRSPVTGSSSSDGSPKHDYSSSPIFSKEDPADVSERQKRRKDDERELDRDFGRSQYGRSGDSYRHSDRLSSRSSHGYSRHDDYIRHNKHADDEERNHQRLASRSGRESRGEHTRHESEHSRSRDYSRNVDKYSRDRYDGSGNRSKDKEKESSSLERHIYKEKDSSSDRTGSGRRHTSSNSEDVDRDRHRRDRDGKKEYRRSSGDYKNDRSVPYEESRGHLNDSSSGRDYDGRRFKDAYKSEAKELDGQKLSKEEKKNYDDWDTKRDRDRHSRAPDHSEDKFGSENQGSPAKKPKLFSSDRATDYVSKFSTTVPDEIQSSISKQAQEIGGKVTLGQVQANGSEASNDLNAAKVAAMKAAELVNKNLVGGGFMSTEQKKKLLWGNKKSTAAEEPGHRWDTALFGDRERQEKFNKLMGVKGDAKVEHKTEDQDGSGLLQAEKQKELQLDLEKQYTAGLRRRDGRTVGLGL